MTGYAAFTWLLPIACLLLAAYVVFRRKALWTLAVKLIAFGLAIVVVVPASVKLSDMIETAYQSSIEQTIESAKEATELIEVSAAEETEEEEGFFSGIVSKVKEGVPDSGAGAGISGVAGEESAGDGLKFDERKRNEAITKEEFT